MTSQECRAKAHKHQCTLSVINIKPVLTHEEILKLNHNEIMGTNEVHETEE